MTVVNMTPAARASAVLNMAQSSGFCMISKRTDAFSGELHVQRDGDDLLLHYADGSAIRVCGLQA